MTVSKLLPLREQRTHDPSWKSASRLRSRRCRKGTWPMQPAAAPNRPICHKFSVIIAHLFSMPYDEVIFTSLTRGAIFCMCGHKAWLADNAWGKNAGMIELPMAPTSPTPTPICSTVFMTCRSCDLSATQRCSRNHARCTEMHHSSSVNKAQLRLAGSNLLQQAGMQALPAPTATLQMSRAPTARKPIDAPPKTQGRGQSLYAARSGGGGEKGALLPRGFQINGSL
jgi:hypothetical protein